MSKGPAAGLSDEARVRLGFPPRCEQHERMMREADAKHLELVQTRARALARDLVMNPGTLYQPSPRRWDSVGRRWLEEGELSLEEQRAARAQQETGHE
jgi:hypothetical protein